VHSLPRALIRSLTCSCACSFTRFVHLLKCAFIPLDSHTFIRVFVHSCPLVVLVVVVVGVGVVIIVVVAKSLFCVEKSE
jgi:hypothetical protein